MKKLLVKIFIPALHLQKIPEEFLPIKTYKLT